MLCFFFFFKQKTAYEMRISDWSSDVCSSDLKARQKARERLARASCRDEQRMLAALRYREHLGLMPPDPPAARGKPVGERDGERHGKDEIGRASCRERVCQYV